MAVRFSVECENVAEFEGLLAALRGSPASVELQPALAMHRSAVFQSASDLVDAVAETAKPAETASVKRTRRTKAEMEAAASPGHTDPMVSPEAIDQVDQDQPVVDEQQPVVETTLEQDVVKAEEQIPPASEREVAAVDYGKLVRAKLAAVRDKFDGAKMLEVLDGFGVKVVKDLAEKKLPEVCAACDAVLAA